jgi:PAS domain S-box-containing protein
MGEAIGSIRPGAGERVTIASPISKEPAADPAERAFGPRARWPAALVFAANVCEHNGLPTAVLWGPERRLIHNRAFEALLGGGGGTGEPAEEALGPLWGAFGPPTEQVERTGQGAFLREERLMLVRDGIEEETYWNCNLLPVLDEGGLVLGVLYQANDVSKTVTVERRLTFQIQLADRLRGLSDPEEVKRVATRLLGEYLGAARVGYAEVDSEAGLARVRSDWTRDEGVQSLAGHKAPLSAFGSQANDFLSSGEVLAIADIGALGLAPEIEAGWESFGVRALITVPLVIGGDLKALLYVHEPRPRAWRRSDAAIARDVAERTWAAVERAQAEQSLRESEDHYRHTVELNPQVTWTAHADGQLNRVANRWEVWTGTTGLGDSWAEAIHPDDRQRSFEVWGASVSSGEPYDIEHRMKMRDGGYRWARSRAYPRRDTKGTIALWYGSTEDIHERKVAEEHQRLLINELNHRVKNTLATVQAIAFQTLKGDIPLSEARQSFEARLMALSRAHNLLTEQNWGRANLDRLVRDAIEHLAGEADRFEIEGAPVWLNPRAALALAMALHELGTNAAKYGALSGDSGRVRIRWREEGDALAVEWKELGGPPVAAPASRGFGSRLIERGLETDLGGSARLAFEADGLRCSIRAELAAILAEERGFG